MPVHLGPVPTTTWASYTQPPFLAFDICLAPTDIRTYASAGDNGEPLKGLRQWSNIRFFTIKGFFRHDVEDGLTWDKSESGESS